MGHGVPQGEGRQHQAHAEGDPYNAGEHPRLVAQGVADDVFLIEAQAPPEEGQLLQQHRLGAFGGLWAHALGRTLLQ